VFEVVAGQSSCEIFYLHKFCLQNANFKKHKKYPGHDNGMEVEETRDLQKEREERREERREKKEQREKEKERSKSQRHPLSEYVNLSDLQGIDKQHFLKI
jgi:hypothetical protein